MQSKNTTLSTGQTERKTTTFVGDGRQRFDLDLTNEHDRAVYETLLKVQETFQVQFRLLLISFKSLFLQKMVDNERMRFMEMFPQFKKVRAAPQVFDDVPLETTTYREGWLT